jgi:sigma-B regulation protein RsbU (phosphoserine phosphatase)
VGAAVHPAEQTGGDYIDFVSARDGSLGVAIGDVNGHGFGAALVMALTRAYIRSFCAQGLGVGKVLNAINRMLLADLEESQYVTLLLVHIDPADGVLSYASAGHVPGFILNRSGEVEAVLQSTGIPLGLLEGHRTGTKLLPMHSGQVVVLVTDGVTEAGEPEEFGAPRMLAYVREHRSESAQQIADGVYRAARTFANNQPQQDDIAVVIVKAE